MIQVPTHLLFGNSEAYSHMPAFIFAQAEAAFLNGIPFVTLTPSEYAQIFGHL